MASQENHTNTETEGAKAQRESRLIQKVALFAFLINLGLAIMKALLAMVSGSLAVSASAIDSATDSVASLILFGGLKLSNRKSANFPLGLYKIENVISIVVALFIFFAGYEIARDILHPAEKAPDVSLLIILLLFLGTAAAFLFGQYALSMGKRTGSPTLYAEGRHRQVDVISSVVVLASVVLSYFQVRFSVFGISIDQIAAGLVLIFIARAGWELLSHGMRVLLDASVDFGTLDRVQKIIESEPMVAEIKSLVGRSAGRFRFLQTDVVLRTDNLTRAHQVSKNIEENILEQVPHIERIIIHYEPQSPAQLRLAVPMADPDNRISDHFGQAPYFALVTLRLTDRKIEKKEVLSNPHRHVETAKGIQVAEWLVKHKVDRVLLKEDVSHKGPGYVFSNAGITVHRVPANDLNKAIEAMISEEADKSEQ